MGDECIISLKHVKFWQLTNIWQNFFASQGLPGSIDLTSRLDEMDAGRSESRLPHYVDTSSRRRHYIVTALCSKLQYVIRVNLVTLHATLSYTQSWNFYAEKQRSNKALPFGARSPVIISQRVGYILSLRTLCTSGNIWCQMLTAFQNSLIARNRIKLQKITLPTTMWPKYFATLPREM